MIRNTNGKTGRSGSIWIVALIVIALLAAGIGGTIAYLNLRSEPVVNTFTAGTGPIPEVVETFNGTTKSDVKVRIDGSTNTPSLVRAAIVLNLTDDEGNVLAQLPVEGTDYTMTLATDGWTKIGDYYYYNSIVQPGGETSVLLRECRTLSSDYHLTVNVIAQTVQAAPADAAAQAWGVSYANGAWS